MQTSESVFFMPLPFIIDINRSSHNRQNLDLLALDLLN